MKLQLQCGMEDLNKTKYLVFILCNGSGQTTYNLKVDIFLLHISYFSRTESIHISVYTLNLTVLLKIL